MPVWSQAAQAAQQAAKSAAHTHPVTAAKAAIRKEAASAVKPYVFVAIAIALYALMRSRRRG
jgi:Flp pilus assembly protein TadG